MNKEEAIKWLTNEKWTNANNKYKKEWNEAFDLAIEALSAEAESDDLIIKGAKGIQDGLYNIKDGKLFKYKAKGGTVRTYPIIKL